MYMVDIARLLCKQLSNGNCAQQDQIVFFLQHKLPNKLFSILLTTVGNIALSTVAAVHNLKKNEKCIYYRGVHCTVVRVRSEYGLYWIVLVDPSMGGWGSPLLATGRISPPPPFLATRCTWQTVPTTKLQNVKCKLTNI